jgi:CBS domain containing-hemolysin-like protein
VFLSLQAATELAQPIGAGTVLLRLGGVLLLVAAAAFFAAAESALVSARRARVDALARGGSRRARLAASAIDGVERHVVAAQLGMSLATVGLAWVGATLVAGMLAAALPALGTVSTWVVAGVVTFAAIAALHVLLGVLVPRSVALLFPEAVLFWIAAPLVLFALLTAPLVAVLRWKTGLILRLFGLRPPSETDRVHRPEELELLLTQTYEHGLLSEEPVEMIRGVFGLSETTAAEIMTPRTSVVAIPADMTVAETAAFILEQGHSRYPVYDESLDRIVGVLLARDVWRAQTAGVRDLPGILRAPLFVPDTKPIEALLRELRRERAHMAIVIDEFGGTEGVVTMEDVVEEIVGEIADELDEAPAELDERPDGAIIVSGGYSIAELNDRYDFRLPDEDYTTVGGFVLGRLGRVAQVGDVVSIRGATLRVLEMQRRRVAKLSLHLESVPTETDDADGGGEEGRE